MNGASAQNPTPRNNTKEPKPQQQNSPGPVPTVPREPPAEADPADVVASPPNSTVPSGTAGKKHQTTESAPSPVPRGAGVVGVRELSGGEIAGIVFGAIGALAGVVGVFVAAFKRNEIVSEMTHTRRPGWNHPVDK